MNPHVPTSEAAELLRRLARAPEIFDALAAESGSELQIQARLRAKFEPELVRMAVEVADLRRSASLKFSRGDALWLTRTGYEQATSELVARHKARRFAETCGDAPVWDLCCGIGGDALALTERCRVIAVDSDPAQLVRTELNVAAYGGAARLTTRLADVTTLELAGQLVHVDPDRRAHGDRSRRLEQYAPPLSWMQELTQRARGGAIKVSPASNFGGKFPQAEIELVSLDGECKEATIWFGALCSADRSVPWRATALPSGASIAGHPLDAVTDVHPPGRFLFDPDPAVVRAGLVDLLAQQLGLWRLDAAEEYLSGEALVQSPLCVPFETTAIVPNNPTAIRSAVRSEGWGTAEIKCRHVRTDADAVRRKLPLTGDAAGVLIIARLAGKTQAVLARRAAPHAPNR